MTRMPFVVTLSALLPLGCEKPPVKHTNPPPVPDPQAEADGPRKRSVRDPLPETSPLSSPVDWANAKHLNPRAEQNRAVMAADDGSCYVEVPENPEGPIGPPGTGLVAKPVDCPDAMQDPAWDSCLGGEIVLMTSGECICTRTGNPPPPPTTAECPKTVP